MKIELGAKYRIKGTSKYFKDKYGTYNPIIVIEDTDIKVFGKRWHEMNGNPAACLFGFRVGLALMSPYAGEVYYGKIKFGEHSSLGELVCESELEEV